MLAGRCGAVAPHTVASTDDGGNGTDSTNSTLLVGSAAITCHKITSGLITFDDETDNDYDAALTLSDENDLAAAVQYLQGEDFGNLLSSVVFNVGSDSYVFTQGDNAGTDSADILTKITGHTVTTMTSTTTTTTAAHLAIT